MIQDKMVRARRQYHHHHHHHHHQPQHNTNTNNQSQHLNTNSSSNNNNNNNSTNHHHNHRHAPLNHHSHRHSNKRPTHVPSAPSNTTQFIMNDHELIEPDFDLMHNAIMEHYNRSKKRKLSQNENDQSGGLGERQAVKKVAQQEHFDALEKDSFAAADENDSTKTLEAAIKVTTTAAATTININKSPRKGELTEESKSHQQQNQMSTCRQQQQQQQLTTTPTTMTTTSNNTQLQESTNQSNPTTPSYRPTTGSPGDEDGLSPFINHEHLQSSEFQEVYANIHSERLSSMSKNQLVDQYLLLEERVEKLENQLRESQTATASAASHG